MMTFIHSIRLLAAFAAMLLLVMAACAPVPKTLPSQPPQPSIMPPTVTPTASTPVPTQVAPVSPTTSALANFARTLKTAVESDDRAALKSLIATEWGIGRYRSEWRTFNTPDAALEAFGPVREGTKVTVDLDRVPVFPLGTQLTDRVLVARWTEADGRETYAHFYLRESDGRWQWAGLLVGLDFYHSPAAAMLVRTPASYAGCEVMLTGDVRAARNDRPTLPDFVAPDTLMFPLLDGSGEAVWVLLSPVVVKEAGFDPTNPTNFTNRVRVIGVVQDVAGGPFVLADFVQPVRDGEFVAVEGTVAQYSASARVFVLAEQPSLRIALLETSTQDYANGTPVTAQPLENGVRVLVMGRPASATTIHAEQIFIYLQ